jgi:ATP synthase protein I
MTDDPSEKFPHSHELKDLDARLKALAAKKQKKEALKDTAAGEQGSGQGFQALGELLGGILGGFGLGWLCDQYLGTKPFGMIAGVLIGLVGAVYLIARSAKDR